MKKYDNHTFVICAYKESQYLEECIKSIVNQTVKSNIIISTSTPNEFINQMAEKYQIPVVVNTGKSGIGQDWNFGVSKTNTDYVTVIHQDDVYESNYLEEIEKSIEKEKDFIIAFTDYREVKNGEVIPLTKNLKIKKLMLKPLKLFKKSKIIRKRVLSIGSPICCPSVTVNTKILGKEPYIIDLKCDLDWDSWYEFSKKNGKFIYINKELMKHRIHEESETSNLIENNIRLEEDLLMLEKFWPKPIAKKIMKHYKKAVDTNNTTEELQKKEEKDVKVRRSKGMQIGFIIIYLILTVSGLILIKKGGSSLNLAFENGIFGFNIGIVSLLGYVCYLCSFLMFTRMVVMFDLSFILPLTTGCVQILSLIASKVIFKEQITTTGLIGACIIIIGIVVMNWKTS